MIVVCTGCAAKFKVADAKVGPKGAKVRCSKCSTVFLVRHDEPVAPAGPPPLPTAPPPPASRPEPAPADPGLEAAWLAPPPLSQPRPAPPAGRPELAAVVRAALDLDLEPAAPRPRPPPASAVPLAAPLPPLPEDPFGTVSAALPPEPHPPPADDPFAPALQADDPFAAVQAPVPDDLIRPPPAAPEAAPVDPFDLDPFGGGGAGGLSLEERPAAPPRPEPVPGPDDPFAAPMPHFDPLQDHGAVDLTLSSGLPGDIPPLSSDLPAEQAAQAAAPAPPPVPAPLRADPFAAAAVDADPLAVAGAAPATDAPAAPDAPDPGRGQRLRAVAVNAVSLAALLVIALALLVVWRGGGAPASLRPSSLLAALTQRPEATGPLVTAHVTSGLYERQDAPPVLFVKGEVQARAAAGPVEVTVELVRGGQVLASGRARAGAPLGPEALHGAAGAEALAKAVAAAEAGAPARLAAGQAAPFLVVFTDYPADLAGVTLRVAAAEARR